MSEPNTTPVWQTDGETLTRICMCLMQITWQWLEPSFALRMQRDDVDINECACVSANPLFTRQFKAPADAHVDAIWTTFAE